jgi:phage terminase small subunit
MPRMSAEERAAAKWRAGENLPKPPKYLPLEARHLWVDIVSSKPAGWFDPGNLPLLAQYCSVTAMARMLTLERNALPIDPQHDRQAARLERRILKTTATMCSLASRLRLTPQSTIDRHSRMLSERGTPRNPLLGGREP